MKALEIERTSWRWSIGVNSGYSEHRPYAAITAFGWWVSARLPKWLLRPRRVKVVAESWDAATVARLGRNWYWDETRREYGISLSDGHLSIQFGVQADDSTVDRRWGCFLPWTQWRYMGIRFFGLMGEEVLWQPSTRRGWDVETAERESIVPLVAFNIKDYDGAEIVATTRMEQREYLFGEGWFKWLSVFRSRHLYPSLNIEFDKETGPEKGSWKGGTMGTGIEMLPGELHEDAFKRYCSEENRSKNGRYRVEYIGRA